MEQLQTEHGVFTNNEFTGQTAEEVYAKWLEDKDKPPKLTEIELVKLSQANQFETILEILGGLI